MNCEHDEKEIELLKEKAKETLKYMRMSEEEKEEYRRKVIEAWREIDLTEV